MALKIMQAAGAALWIAVALSSPRLVAADTVFKMGGLSTHHPASTQSPGY